MLLEIENVKINYDSNKINIIYPDLTEINFVGIKVSKDKYTIDLNNNPPTSGTSNLIRNC